MVMEFFGKGDFGVKNFGLEILKVNFGLEILSESFTTKMFFAVQQKFISHIDSTTLILIFISHLFTYPYSQIPDFVPLLHFCGSLLVFIY
jgi:hypothetical protein